MNFVGKTKTHILISLFVWLQVFDFPTLPKNDFPWFKWASRVSFESCYVQKVSLTSFLPKKFKILKNQKMNFVENDNLHFLHTVFFILEQIKVA